MALLIEKLDSARHDRADFLCGVLELDRFLHELAAQHQRRNFSTTYVLVESATAADILGYYSVSFGALHLSDLSPIEQKKLPKHPVPAARIGRLAVGQTQYGNGYGALLLQNAVKRCLLAREQIACYALVVDTKNDVAARFYEKFGFFACMRSKEQWYLPLGRSP